MRDESICSMHYVFDQLSIAHIKSSDFEGVNRSISKHSIGVIHEVIEIVFIGLKLIMKMFRNIFTIDWKRVSKYQQTYFFL